MYDKVNERFKTGAATHHFSKVDDLRYCIEIRSVKMMYSWFEYFIRVFKEEYHNRFNIEDTGFWDKYGRGF